MQTPIRSAGRGAWGSAHRRITPQDQGRRASTLNGGHFKRRRFHTSTGLVSENTGRATWDAQVGT